MVEITSRRSGGGRKTVPAVRKRSGDPPGGSKVVGRPFRRSGTGRKTLQEIWN